MNSRHGQASCFPTEGPSLTEGLPVLRGCSPCCNFHCYGQSGSQSYQWLARLDVPSCPLSAVIEPESAHVLAGRQRTVSPLLMHRLHGPRGLNSCNSSSEFGLLSGTRYFYYWIETIFHTLNWLKKVTRELLLLPRRDQKIHGPKFSSRVRRRISISEWICRNKKRQQ